MHSSQHLLNQANKALAKPSQTQQTQAGQSDMNAVAPLINEVFDQLQTMFGRKYTSRFGNSAEIDKTKRIWAISFLKEQITINQIKYALEQVLYMRMSWPPELIEFLALCDHESVTGMPSLEEAATRIIECNTKYRFDKTTYEQKHLQHPMLAVLNIRCAQHVNKDEKTFNKHMQREYKTALMQHKAGTLPQIKKALPAPAIDHITHGYQPQNPNDPFLQRVAKVRDLFKAKQ
ncbi:replication protein P [uncultured Paraglaciecola sp.]|uniref:replication protein P n=1 Tax=uncultured Paraglaciecola sp. TaxID=1765024 RepID=UPI00260638C0|nr:replication protein P [uncultured Paraglaciecola sp.]